MTLLFDPLRPPVDAWPADAPEARAYIEGVARLGVSAAIANCSTRWLALRHGAQVLPVTVNDGEIGGSYVCLPHSAYALYACREIDLVGLGAAAPVLKAAALGLGGLLRAAGANRIVHLDNWLLSTNLHGTWQGEGLAAMRDALARQFPRHILAVRSVDARSCPGLLAALRADGWCLVPSRQVWLTEDLPGRWQRSRDYAHDRRLLRRTRLSLETLLDMTPAEAERIAALYRQLYVGKYSALNPIFTGAWIVMTHRTGTLRYAVARDADRGEIVAVAGTLARGDMLTTPVVGYDMARPRAEGLYRIACVLASEAALAGGLRLNGSAGAAEFKRLRGAQPVIEYWAMDARHLAAPRRLAIAALAAALERWAVPIMQERRL